jgi:hypothetical protein
VHVAVSYRPLDVIVLRLLLGIGDGDPNIARDSDGCMPLHLAIQSGASLECVALLLRGGASPHVKWREHRPSDVAQMLGRLDIVTLMLQSSTNRPPPLPKGNLFMMVDDDDWEKETATKAFGGNRSFDDGAAMLSSMSSVSSSSIQLSVAATSTMLSSSSSPSSQQQTSKNGGTTTTAQMQLLTEDRTVGDILWCSFCSKSGVRLQRCRGCAAAFYCSVTCYNEHWITHKSTCKLIVKMRENGRDGNNNNALLLEQAVLSSVTGGSTVDGGGKE